MKYRAVSAAAHRVDAGLTLLTSETWPAAVPVDSDAARVLAHCLAERSLDGHADHVVRVLGIADQQTVASHIQSLVARGLLRPVEIEPGHRAAAPGAEPGPSSPPADLPITTLAIVTADRPAALARSIVSYVRHLDEQGRATRVLVVDTSFQAENREETARVVADARAAAARSREVEYLGADSRAGIRQRLSHLSGAGEVLEWLLSERSETRAAGRARNHLLLATAGERVLTVDDDTVCVPWRLNEAEDGLALAGHVDPRDTRFFASRADALASIAAEGPGPRPSAGLNLLAAHEALLGRSIAALVETARGACDLESVCRHLLPAIDGRRPGWSVRATWSGLAGDAATYCPYPLLFASGPTRDRLAASEDAMRLALASREVVRAVRRPTVTDEPWLMTYCAALDNTRLLPPFAPLITNEDTLFGGMLRLTDPAACFGQTSCGIVHDSSRSSAYEGPVMRSASEIRLSDLVQWLLGPIASACVTTDAAERTRRLGRHLVDCGGLEPRVWRAHVTEVVVEARRRLLMAADATLSNGFPYPPYWRSVLRGYQQAVLDALQAPSFYLPVELADSPSLEDGLTRAQAYVRDFGRALMVWPEVWQIVGEHRRGR